MPNLNQVTLIGHAGKDIEVRSTSAGEVASFSLATSYSYKDKSGGWQTSTDWHNIELWKPTDHLKASVKKGTLVIVEGRISYDTYEKDGQKKYMTRIKADRVQVGKTSATADVSEPEPDAADAQENDLPF